MSFLHIVVINKTVNLRCIDYFINPSPAPRFRQQPVCYKQRSPRRKPDSYSGNVQPQQRRGVSLSISRKQLVKFYFYWST